MKELEDANAKLKGMFADMSLENHALKELIQKMAGAHRREAVVCLIDISLPVGRACAVMRLGRASFYRKPKDCRLF